MSYEPNELAVPQSIRKRGRPRQASTAALPPGMLVKTRAGATYYYLSRAPKKGAKRTQEPLGKTLTIALAHYKVLTDPQRYIKHSSVPMLPWVTKELFATCRSHSARRKIAFNLTYPDVEKLLADSENKCALTGIHFETRLPEGARFRHWMPSIDRIDCRGCYEVGNVRLVAMAVNIALNDIGEEALVHIARMLLRKRRASL